MPPLEDTAEELIAHFSAWGAVTTINALGTVASGTISPPDPTVAAVTTATLGASALPIALPPPGGIVGKKLRVLLTQDATGSRTLGAVTVAGGAVTWVGAAAPTLTVTAAHADLLEFESFDGTNFVGSAKLNIH